MKWFLMLSMVLAACAPAAQEKYLLLENQPSYTVTTEKRMDNNFVLPSEANTLVEVNFSNAILPINSFAVVYEGKNWRFLNGPADIFIDGQRYGAAGETSRRTTLSSGRLLEINVYSFSDEVKAALKNATSVSMTFSGSLPLKVEFSPENLTRMKAFLQ